MRRIFIGTLVVLTIALINGCANRKITRVDPNETIDLSGRWNDSDSRLVSEEMIGDLLTSAWIPRYLKANDKRPVVVVGLVENKSHEHINSETFIKDVEKAIIRDGNIRLVVAGEKRNELRKERAEQQDYASPETTKKWGKMIENYLHTSKKLQAVFLLIDIRHDPSANDKMMYDWMVYQGFTPIIIATKLDKIKRSQIQKNVKAIREGLKVKPGTVIIPFSSETKQGRDELWEVIDSFVLPQEETEEEDK